MTSVLACAAANFVARAAWRAHFGLKRLRTGIWKVGAKRIVVAMAFERVWRLAGAGAPSLRRIAKVAASAESTCYRTMAH